MPTGVTDQSSRNDTAPAKVEPDAAGGVNAANADAPQPAATPLSRVLAWITSHPFTTLFTIALAAMGVVAVRRQSTEWDEIFLRSAQVLLQGKNIYREFVGFTYPPFPAWVSIPFAYLPLHVARALWFILCAGSLGYLIKSSWRLAGGPRIEPGRGAPPVAGREIVAGLIGQVIALQFALNALTHLQADLPIAAMLMAGCAAIATGRFIRGATWIGIAAAFKATPLLFAPYLLWRRQWRAAAWLVIVAIGANLLPNIVHSPPGDEWNSVVSPSSTPLLGINRAKPSSLSVSYSGDVDTSSLYSNGGKGPLDLMNGCLVSHSTDLTHAPAVTISGLDPEKTYDLYVYSGSNVDARVTAFSIDGLTNGEAAQRLTYCTNADAGGMARGASTFTQGTDEFKFASLAPASDGTLTIKFYAASDTEGDCNGFQIAESPVQKPPPAPASAATAAPPSISLTNVQFNPDGHPYSGAGAIGSAPGGLWLTRWYRQYLKPMGSAQYRPGDWKNQRDNNQAVAGAINRWLATTWAANNGQFELIDRPEQDQPNPLLMKAAFGLCCLAMLLPVAWAEWARRRRKAQSMAEAGGSLLSPPPVLRGRVREGASPTDVPPESPLPRPPPEYRGRENDASVAKGPANPAASHYRNDLAVSARLPSPAMLECGIVFLLMLLFSPNSSRAHFCIMYLPAFCVARLALRRGAGWLLIALLALAAICSTLSIHVRLPGSQVPEQLMLWVGVVMLSAFFLLLATCRALARCPAEAPQGDL